MGLSVGLCVTDNIPSSFVGILSPSSSGSELFTRPSLSVSTVSDSK